MRFSAQPEMWEAESSLKEQASLRPVPARFSADLLICFLCKGVLTFCSAGRRSAQYSHVVLCSSIALLSVLAGGCVSKPYTKPRSEVVQESQKQGLPTRSMEEERALFKQLEADTEERVLAFIRSRSSGEFRDPTYRIGAGDDLEINVFDVPELNVTAKVRESGFISLPLIGAVRVLGSTESEVVDELKSRLKTFVRSPEISVAISHYGSQLVAVLGAVRTPGSYPLKRGNNSILELLSQAGGVSEKAGNLINFVPAELSGISQGSDSSAAARAQLAFKSLRREGANGSNLELYLDQVLGTNGAIPLEIPVRGGDMVIVPEAGKVMVEGEVAKSGSYDLSQQLTMLGALAAAGGITYSAKIDEVEVVREMPGGEKIHYVGDLQKLASGEDSDIRLRNGDIVRVPSDSGKRLTEGTYTTLTKIINFGVGGTYNVK